MIRNDNMSYLDLLYLVKQGYAPTRIVNGITEYYWSEIGSEGGHKYLSVNGTWLLKDLADIIKDDETLIASEREDVLYAGCFADDSYHLIPVSVYNKYKETYNDDDILYVRYISDKTKLDIINRKSYSNLSNITTCQDIKQLKIDTVIDTLCPNVWYNWETIAMK